jgi:hypothetical protein
MLPNIAFPNHSDQAWADSKFYRKDRAGLIAGTDSNNPDFSQFGVGMRRAARHVLYPFWIPACPMLVTLGLFRVKAHVVRVSAQVVTLLCRIKRIFQVSPLKDVLWSAARWVIASMASKELAQILASSKKVNKSTNTNLQWRVVVIAQRQFPVLIWIRSAVFLSVTGFENPAITVRSLAGRLIDLRPKAFKFFLRWIGCSKIWLRHDLISLKRTDCVWSQERLQRSCDLLIVA